MPAATAMTAFVMSYRIISNDAPMLYSVHVGAIRKYKIIVTIPIIKKMNALVRAMSW